MKLQIHSIHFDADIKLTEFIQRKADKLETFYDRILDGEVFLRLDKNKQRENKQVEIKLNYPGGQFFAKAVSSTFEEATDATIEALRRQVRKHKTKNGNSREEKTT